MPGAQHRSPRQHLSPALTRAPATGRINCSQLPPLSYEVKQFLKLLWLIASTSHHLLLAAGCFIRYQGLQTGETRSGSSGDPSSCFSLGDYAANPGCKQGNFTVQKKCYQCAISLCNACSPFIPDLTTHGWSWSCCFHREVKLSIISYTFVVEAHHRAERQIRLLLYKLQWLLC